MSSTQVPSKLNQVREGLFTRFWRHPDLIVARFTLRSYIRSGWILLDIVLIWLLYATFFLEFGGDVPYFYGTAGPGLYTISILSTVILVHRSTNARMYLPLARLSSRSSYVRGLIIATGILRIFGYLLMLILAAGYHMHVPIFGMKGATFTTVTVGGIGFLINCIFLSTLTVVLSVPIATRRIQIAFLLLLAIILYSNTSSTTLAQYLAVVRIPLAPLATCVNLGQTMVLDLPALGMVLLAAGYIGVLTILATYWFNRRDLLLH